MANKSPKISRGASPSLFKCCDTKPRTVSVPNIKYVLTQQPIVVEKIHKEVKYNQIPVSYEFETRRKPIQVVKACPRSPKCGARSPVCGARSPVCGSRSPVCGSRSPVCGSRRYGGRRIQWSPKLHMPAP